MWLQMTKHNRSEKVKYLHVTKNQNLFQVYFKDTGPTQVV